MGIRKELEIIITPDGEVKITPKGLKGKECLDLTQLLSEALGEVKERKFTSDYYEREAHITDKGKISRKVR